MAASSAGFVDVYSGEVSLDDDDGDKMSLPSNMRNAIASMILNNYVELDKYAEVYTEKRLIGKGGFGSVYEAINNETGKKVAVKKVHISYEMDYSNGSVSYTSVSDRNCVLEFVKCCQEAMLQSVVFSHPNIVMIHDKWIQNGRKRPKGAGVAVKDVITITEFLQHGNHDSDVFQLTETVRQALLNIEGVCIYMAMELYDKSLKTWLSADERDQNETEVIIKQLIVALSYIHSKGYSHCDLTPANILIKEHDDIQGIKTAITDFGLSQSHASPTALAENKNRQGMPPYNLAPDKYLTVKFDMWSFGLIIYDVLSARKTTTKELFELCQLAEKHPRKVAAFVARSIIKGQGYYTESIVSRCLVPTFERITSSDLEAEYNNISSSDGNAFPKFLE